MNWKLILEYYDIVGAEHDLIWLQSTWDVSEPIDGVYFDTETELWYVHV